MSKTSNTPLVNVLTSFKPNLCVENNFYFPIKIQIEKLYIINFLNSPCTICFNLLKNPTRIIPCNHIFCKSCLKIWRKTCNNCPLCRGTIAKAIKA